MTQPQDRAGRTISLAEITDDNWRAVADVAPHDDQRRFVAALGARYSCSPCAAAYGIRWPSWRTTRGGSRHVGDDGDDGTHWMAAC